MPGYYYEIEQKDSTAAPQAAPIRPFRLLDPKMLPQPVRAVFHLHWEPVLQIMSQSPTGLHIPKNPTNVTASQFSELYDKAFAYLKANRLGYVFNKGPKVKPMEDINMLVKARPAIWDHKEGKSSWQGQSSSSNMLQPTKNPTR